MPVENEAGQDDGRGQENEDQQVKSARSFFTAGISARGLIPFFDRSIRTVLPLPGRSRYGSWP
jgi:hypothetical protein